jgi:2-polyprenyl-6-methoxyphenol hydroxylase-like FAD-dependent oxidoreductase
MYGPGMQELGAMSHDGLACCCEFQCSLPQYETQRILEEHLVAQGGAVERGVTATQIVVDDDGPAVTLVDAAGNVEITRPRFIIGAGGAHSVTRHSMSQSLGGATYRGHFLVADIAMEAPFPRREAGVICTRAGMILLAPLPGGRWISFQDLEEEIESVTADDVAVRVVARLGERFRPADVSWLAPFRMHRRIVSRMADGRRFLIGDAAHLSSPFGGEGLNAGLHDGYDLAWKLALVVHGHAGEALLDGYAAERHLADEHVLAVSDLVHAAIVEAVEAARRREPLEPATVDPIEAALMRNARAMLDVDYAGSPLVADFGSPHIRPRPGQWFPDWPRVCSTSHVVLAFGAADPESLSRFERRWSSLVKLLVNPQLDPAQAGVPGGGLVLVRPDGHIGLRHPSVDANAWAALDRHLASYLVTAPV